MAGVFMLKSMCSLSSYSSDKTSDHVVLMTFNMKYIFQATKRVNRAQLCLDSHMLLLTICLLI